MVFLDAARCRAEYSSAMRRPTSIPLITCTLPLLAAAACTGADPEPVGADSAATPEVIAIVALTWRQAEPTGAGRAQVYVVEHAPGQRAAALERLSMPAAAHVLDTSLGVGECRLDGPRADPGRILLRDAGEIMVEDELGVNVLDSSWVSEGSLDVTGVAYAGYLGARAEHRGPVALAADGSPEVGPFSVSLAPPPAVRLRAVGGHPVVRGRVPVGDSELAQGLDIAWEPPSAPPTDPSSASAPPTSADLTVVVFERRSFGATWTISCAVEDDGHFAIPAAAFLALPDLGADRTDSVLVRRIASASFGARHLPEGLAVSVSEDQAYVE